MKICNGYVICRSCDKSKDCLKYKGNKELQECKDYKYDDEYERYKNYLGKR